MSGLTLPAAVTRGRHRNSTPNHAEYQWVHLELSDRASVWLCEVSADVREGSLLFQRLSRFNASVPCCCTILLSTTIQTNSHPVLILS